MNQHVETLQHTTRRMHANRATAGFGRAFIDQYGNQGVPAKISVESTVGMKFAEFMRRKAKRSRSPRRDRVVRSPSPKHRLQPEEPSAPPCEEHGQVATTVVNVVEGRTATGVAQDAAEPAEVPSQALKLRVSDDTRVPYHSCTFFFFFSSL